METRKLYNAPTIEIVHVNCVKQVLQNIGDGTTSEHLGNVQNWDSEEDETTEDLNSSIWE